MELLIAFVGIVGVVVGASLQAVFSLFLSRSSARKSERAKAYAEYMAGVASIKYATDLTRADAMGRLAAVKARLSIYGDSTVVAKLAELERVGGDLSRDEDQRAFLDLVRAMRRDAVGDGEPALSKDLSMIIFSR